MIDFFNSFPLWTQAVFATLLTWFITALGASLVFFFKKVNKTLMDSMMALAAGVMIAASFWSLLNPAINLAEELEMNAWLMAALGFLSGGIFLVIGDYTLNKYLTKLKKTDEFKHNKFKRSFMLVSSITLHNIPEGLSIGVAFGMLAHNYSEVALFGAIMLALGIGIQNFPEGAAVSLPLRREGVSRIKSFLIGNLSGVVEPISALFGCLLVTQIRNFLPFSLAFAAGAMIYVAVSELIPESQKNKHKILISMFTLIGFSIMMILDVALG